MHRRCPWHNHRSLIAVFILGVLLPTTGGAADRAARFREYDARRTETLEKMAQANDLNGALARLYLKKEVETANRIVLESDFAKIYWANNTVLIPLYEMFNADTGSRAKLLSREATDKILAYFWQCFQPEGKAGGHIARHYHFLPDQPWQYWGNQNHGFVYQTLFYTAATALKDVPEYADQFDPVQHVPLGAGVDDLEEHPELAKITLPDYASRGRDMWRNRLLWMARQGLWAEDMIYRLSNVEGCYNLAYHADDPVIRKRAEMILDLHWLLYALQTVDGQFGGAQNRFKPHYAGYRPERGTGWYYFGGRPGTQPCTAALLGDYLPPEIAYRLLERPDKRGCFVYRERLTQFSPETGQPPPVYKVSYVTPEYVLGTYVAHDLAGGAGDGPQGQAIGRYAERAFNGITFGKARAVLRLGPAVSFQSYHCMQHGPILLCRWYGRELVGADSPWGKRVGEQRPYASIISREGGGASIEAPVLEDGWLFLEAADAWFAMRPAEGQCTINAENKQQFEWAEAKVPLVIHAGGATEDGSFESFKKKVLSNHLTYSGGVLSYEDPKWGKMEFCPDPARPADRWRRIDGKPVALPDKLFDCPYLRSDYNTGVVTTEFDERKLVLDFNKAERTEH